MKENSPTKKIGLILFVFTLYYFTIRLPLMNVPMIGEDGTFAHLITVNPSKPLMNLGGQISNTFQYLPFGHPTLMYEALSTIGQISEYFLQFSQGSEMDQTKRIRFFFSLFQYTAWILVLLAWTLRQRSELQKVSLTQFFPILVASSTLIALITSVELQMDTSIGVLITGVMSFILLYEDNYSKRSMLQFFFCGLLFSIGKNEWAIAFAFGLFMASMGSFLLEKKLRAPLFKLTFAGFLGVGLGSVLHAAYDPLNFMQGWRLMTGMGQSQSVVGQAGIEWFAYTNYLRLPFIYPLCLGIGVAVLGMWRHFKRHTLTPSHLLAFSLSFSLFLPFFLSTWGVYPRYFIPSLICIVVANLLIWQKEVIHFRTSWAAGLFAGISLISAVQLPQVVTTHQKIRYKAEETLRQQSGDCVAYVDTALGIFLSRDYLGSSLNLEQARQIAQSMGKKLCL